MLPKYSKTMIKDFDVEFHGDFSMELIQDFHAEVVPVLMADGNYICTPSAKTETHAGVDFNTGFRKLVPQAVDGMGTDAMTESHPPWSQPMQRGDRALHSFGRGIGEMQPADERIDRKSSRLIENVIERVDGPCVGTAEDHG